MNKNFRIAGIILVFFMLFSTSFGNESKKFWIGNIHIKHTISQSYEIEKSTVSRRSRRTKIHNFKDTVVILACIKDNGNICILKADRSLNDSYKEKSFGQNTKDICPLTKEQMKHNFLYRAKHFKQKVMRPGDSTEASTVYERSLYKFPEQIMKDQAGVQLRIHPDGNYSLTAYHITKVDYKFDSSSESKFVCDNKKRIVETHITTGKTGDEPRSTKLESGEGNNSHTVFNSVQPPLTAALMCIAEGKIEGDRISGSKVIIDKKAKKATDKAEKYTAHWDFTYVDPMHFMVECLNRAKDSLNRELQLCFEQLNIKNSECYKSDLINCIMSHLYPEEDPFSLGKDELAIPGILTFSDCIKKYCSVPGDKNATEKLRAEVSDCFERAFSNYRKLLEECDLYGTCDTCFK
ncbi:MAG: hypothetical protein KAS21_06755 [Candidatus Aminicenantes bacterium]|nr:hypothetical protein [Candidatus Aminicenantes bacterium]